MNGWKRIRLRVFGFSFILDITLNLFNRVLRVEDESYVKNKCSMIESFTIVLFLYTVY